MFNGWRELFFIRKAAKLVYLLSDWSVPVNQSGGSKKPYIHQGEPLAGKISMTNGARSSSSKKLAKEVDDVLKDSKKRIDSANRKAREADEFQKRSKSKMEDRDKRIDQFKKENEHGMRMKRKYEEQRQNNQSYQVKGDPYKSYKIAGAVLLVALLVAFVVALICWLRKKAKRSTSHQINTAGQQEHLPSTYSGVKLPEKIKGPSPPSYFEAQKSVPMTEKV